jgi:predicted transcriptional regulator
MPSSYSYDQAEEKLKAFTRSAVRTRIMLCLREEPMSAAQLEEEMGIRASTILHSIREMIESGLVGKSGQVYSLTNIGRIEARMIDELVSAIVILEKHKDFWLDHDISGIPEDLLVKIGTLGQSQIISADPVALLKVHQSYVKEIRNSSEIYGVSPIIFPDHSSAIAYAVRNGAKVELILTSKILDIIYKEHSHLLNEVKSFSKFKLYKIEGDVKVAFTVTDRLISLGLFGQDGTYDMLSDLFCYGEKAKSWGMELFEHYRSLAKPVSFKL